MSLPWLNKVLLLLLYIYYNFPVRMRIRLQLLANQNWRSNGYYQSLACAPGSGYENGEIHDYHGSDMRM